MKDRGLAWIVFAVLLAADAAAWSQILLAPLPRAPSITFLDVGQGDSILLELSGGVRILTDAGPDSSVLRSLDKVSQGKGRYIDLAVITHPELDHFNGFSYIVEAYDIGAFIINGRDHPGSKQWQELLQKISDKKIPLIALGAGDAIRHNSSRVDIISPDAQIAQSGELNDTGLAQKVRTQDFTALLAADIGTNVEEYLRQRYDLSADILKVGHHGSKYSSGVPFLRAVGPVLAVISSGARNRYGHPAPETLERLAGAGVPVARTDQLGNITVRRHDGKLKLLAAPK